MTSPGFELELSLLKLYNTCKLRLATRDPTETKRKVNAYSWPTSPCFVAASLTTENGTL
jgi:hypothetical protein